MRIDAPRGSNAAEVTGSSGMWTLWSSGLCVPSIWKRADKLGHDHHKWKRTEADLIETQTSVCASGKHDINRGMEADCFDPCLPSKPYVNNPSLGQRDRGPIYFSRGRGREIGIAHACQIDRASGERLPPPLDLTRLC
jgi:hypothetical protein